LEAACFLFEITGDVAFRDYFDLHYQDSHMMQWNFVYPYEGENQEALLYYTKLENGTPSVKNNIINVYKDQIQSGDINLPAHINFADPYFAFLDSYTWGSNAVKSSQGNNFYNLISHAISGIDSSLISNTAQTYIHYIHGVNPMNFLYLSNMYDYGGDHGVNEFYHSWFKDGSPLWDRVGVSTYGPPPGYLTGGTNPSYDWDGCCPGGCGSAGNNSICTSESISPPKGQPAQKSYKDFNTSWPLNSWSISENSCGYQVRYIRLLSKFVNLEKDCNGDAGGTAFIDSCGNCAGGNTGITPSLDESECDFAIDCAGVQNGSAFIDSCGNCAGENTGHIPVLDTLQCIEPPVEYRVFFHITDSNTGDPLWSASINIDEKTEISDREGMAEFIMTEGEYDFNINKLSYAAVQDVLNLSSDTTVEIELIRTHASLKFRLRNGTTPVNNATILLNDESMVSNALGLATFDQMPVSQSYSYTITKEGFMSIEGNIELETDTTLEFQFEKDLTFIRNNRNDEEFHFWPNPAKNKIFIQTNLKSSYSTLKITDVKGRLVMEKEISGQYNEISLEYLETGVYFLNHIHEEGNGIYLFIKKD
ncbi:MAG: glycoside hydrolase family 9 protein, partial [Bacteroidales bacterium]